MANITGLQKFGITVLVLSIVGGAVGTILSVYLSFSALETAETSGIGAVGDQLSYAILFIAGGIIGCFVGLVLFIVGRSRT
jgi:hypothetical protein